MRSGSLLGYRRRISLMISIQMCSVWTHAGRTACWESGLTEPTLSKSNRSPRCVRSAARFVDSDAGHIVCWFCRLLRDRFGAQEATSGM